MAKQENKITTGEYVIGFCSFIPVLGVVLGLVSVVLGALKFKAGGWKLIALGVSGILFTVVIYASFFLFIFKGDAFKHNRGFELLAKENLQTTLMAVEFYKQVHGQYPDQLEDMVDKTNNPYAGLRYIKDDSNGFTPGKKQPTFYYELTPDKQHYYLLGVGPDGLPFTADDLNPDLTPDELAHVGYLKKPAL